MRKTSSVTQKANKYRIVIVLPFGPFPSMESVTLMKRKIKAKYPNVVFSASTKFRSEYKFVGNVSYTERIDASRRAVLISLRQSVQGAKKITVTQV